MIFQSTPSVKRATKLVAGGKLKKYISIHTLCEEGDYLTNLFLKNNYISIHTLCEEGDTNVL